MNRHIHLGAAAGAALMAALTGTAQAVPYAYGTINFSNLSLTGLAGPGVFVTD